MASASVSFSREGVAYVFVSSVASNHKEKCVIYVSISHRKEVWPLFLSATVKEVWLNVSTWCI